MWHFLFYGGPKWNNSLMKLKIVKGIIFLTSIFKYRFLTHFSWNKSHTVFCTLLFDFFLFDVNGVQNSTLSVDFFSICAQKLLFLLFPCKFSRIKNLYHLFQIIFHNIKLLWDFTRVLIFIYDKFYQKYNISYFAIQYPIYRFRMPLKTIQVFFIIIYLFKPSRSVFLNKNKKKSLHWRGRNWAILKMGM